MAVLGLLLLAGLAVLPAATAASYSCEPSPEIRQALDSLPDLRDFRVPYETRMATLRALLEKHPRDIFVHRRYQDAFRRSLHMAREFDRAFALYRSRPDDPLYRFLEARLTGSFHANKAEEMLGQLIKEHPDFPWPHLAIVELMEHPGRRDAKKAAIHLGAFLRGCPESLEGLSLLHMVQDPEMVRQGTAKLREWLEARRKAVTLVYWPTLWDLEFRVSPKEQHESQRRRVLRDVEALKKTLLAPRSEWLRVFWHARRLTLDDGIDKWLEETVLHQFPDSHLALVVETERWSRQNPPPKQDAKPEEWQAHQARERVAREEWRKRWPGHLDLLWHDWFFVDQDAAASVPIERRLAACDAFLALMQESPDAGSSSPPFSTLLAERYVKWQVRLDQVPRLVLQGLKEAEEQSKYRLDPSMIPEEYRGQEEDDVAFTRQRGHLILTDLYLATKQPELAREAIRQGLEEIERFDRMPDATSRRPRSYGFLGSEWLTRRARLAEIEGDIPNAVSLYQQSLRSVPAEFLEGKDPQSEEITAVKKYYLAHGGRQESWLEWAKAAGGPEPVKLEAPPLEFTKHFPDFEASDLSGKIWRLADLKGRVTFIDVWATWCGPCRGEHGELQSFYDKIKDRKDLQLLTFSTDETEYQAAAYMKENKYTFPVIVGKELAEKLFPVVGLPSGWVVNRDAIRSSIFHFRGAEGTLKELEKVAGTR